MHPKLVYLCAFPEYYMRFTFCGRTHCSLGIMKRAGPVSEFFEKGGFSVVDPFQIRPKQADFFNFQKNFYKNCILNIQGVDYARSSPPQNQLCRFAVKVVISNFLICNAKINSVNCLLFIKSN